MSTTAMIAGALRSVPRFCFTVTEHDPERPWIIVGARRDAVELESEHAFHQWASERWPRAVFTVQLDAGSGPIRFRRNLST